jgi:hypothetical protein
LQAAGHDRAERIAVGGKFKASSVSVDITMGMAGGPGMVQRLRRPVASAGRRSAACRSAKQNEKV